MTDGFIPLSRMLLEWDWHDEPKTGWLYVVMMMMANHEDTRWRGETLRRGQLLTGRKHLSAVSGLTEDEVRTALGHLKKTNDIRIESRNRYSIVTMLKYEIHCPAERPTNPQREARQIPSEIPSEIPNRSPADPHIQKLKNLKNKKERENARATRFTPPTVEEVTAYCKERGNGVDAQRFVDFYACKGWKVGKNGMQDWRAAVRTWERRESEDRSQQPKAQSVEELYGGYV